LISFFGRREWMAKEIIFESLPEDVQKALELLKKVREKAIKGIRGHKISDCPIAKGYMVIASGLWSNIYGGNLARLENAGWNKKIYSSFLRWYDCPSIRSKNRLKIRGAREDFLREFLSQ